MGFLDPTPAYQISHFAEKLSHPSIHANDYSIKEN